MMCPGFVVQLSVPVIVLFAAVPLVAVERAQPPVPELPCPELAVPRWLASGLGLWQWCVIEDGRGGELKHGPWRARHVNGVTLVEGELDRGQRVGRWTYRDSRGRLLADGEYERDERSGRWTFWNADGNKHRRGVYRNGKAQGQWTAWQHNGATLFEGVLRDGWPNGPWVVRDQAGVKRAEGTFRTTPDGGAQRHGHWIFRDDAGRVQSSGEFRDGRMHGTWMFWHRSGELESKGTFSNGHRVGQWTFWNNAGTKVRAGSYRLEDRPGRSGSSQDGMWTYWDDAGRTRRCGQYVMGTPVGTWTYWLPDGRARAVHYQTGRFVPQQPTTTELARYRGLLQCPEGAQAQGAPPPFGRRLGCERPRWLRKPVRHGKTIEWYASGQKWGEREYVDGVLHGPFFQWHDDGTPSATQLYREWQKARSRHGIAWRDRGRALPRRRQNRCVDEFRPNRL